MVKSHDKTGPSTLRKAVVILFYGELPCLGLLTIRHSGESDHIEFDTNSLPATATLNMSV